MGLSLKKIIVLVCLISFAGVVFGISDEDVAKITSAMPDKPVVKPDAARKMLVFNLCKGFRHRSIPHWKKALDIMAEKTGSFTVDHSKDMSVFTAENLKQYDAICFNNTTRLVPDAAQQKAIMNFITGGKGIVGIHAATDNFYNWPEGKEMMGGVFTGHPWGGGGTWAVKIDDPAHPLTKMFEGKSFKVNDEIYRTDPPLYSRKNQRVLLSLDMSDQKTKARAGKPTDADTGITWIKSVGKGRLFYCSLGHNNHLTWNKPVLEHFLAGIQFAMGDLDADAAPAAGAKISADKIEDLLGDVKDYDFGKSRKPLIAVEDAIKSVNTNPASLAVIEKAMNNFLETDATFAAKQFVCQKLSIIGTEKSASVLGSLIKQDPKIAAAAIMAMERIGGSKVEDVLLANLDSSQGDIKVGIINALGGIKSQKSVDAIGELALSSDKKVASAAIAALNSIPSRQASMKLSKVLKEGGKSLKASAQQAKLESYYTAPDGGWKYRAYKAIYDDAATSAIKAGAFRGMVLSSDQSAGLIADALKSEHTEVVDTAVSVTGCIKDEKGLGKIFSGFDKYTADVQYKLLGFTEQAGISAGAEAAFKSVSSDNEQIRIAALNALEQVGGEKAVSVMADKAAHASGTEQRTARECLYGLKGASVDDKIVLLIKVCKDNEMVSELLAAVGERSITCADNWLILMTGSSDTNVARQAYRSLAVAGKADDLDDAVKLLVNLENEVLRSEAENCLASIIVKNDADVKPVVSALNSAKDPKVKASLIAALGKTSSPDSYSTLVKYLDSADDSVKTAAIRSLSGWDNGLPAEKLLKTAESSTENIHQVLAFRGFVSTVGRKSDRSVDENINLLKKAMTIAANSLEKKKVLSALGGMPNAKTLELAMSYIDDPELKNEAAMAAIAIGDRLRRADKDTKEKAKQAMKKLLEVSSSKTVKDRAKRVLKRL